MHVMHLAKLKHAGIMWLIIFLVFHTLDTAADSDTYTTSIFPYGSVQIVDGVRKRTEDLQWNLHTVRMVYAIHVGIEEGLIARNA